MDRLSSILKLRDMLFQMERDLGLDQLSPVERDVFLAAHSLTGSQGDPVQSERIRSHQLVQGIAQATYHRALKSLLKMGFLERAGESRAKHYVVRFEPPAE